MNEDYEEYLDAKAEARACGDLDFPSYEEWKNPEETRIAADERMKDTYV